MKKLIFLGIGSALMFTMGGVGTAQADGGIHNSTQGVANTTYNVATAGATRCAGCHRTHTAKAALLLKQAQPALCFSCHGTAANGSKTDVQNGVNANTGEALRGGGFDYALIGAGEATKTLGPALVPDPITGLMPPSYKQTHSATVPALAATAAEVTTSKHQIDGVGSGTMWGNGAISTAVNAGKAAVTLECGSCHDPHGNGNYRILKPLPVDSDALGPLLTPAVPASAVGVLPVVAFVPATYGPAVGVAIPDVPVGVARVYTTTDYWSVTDRTVPAVKGVQIDGTKTDGYIANASQWCSTCHTRYLAKAPDYETNSGDAVFTYRHTSGRTDRLGVERPNCIQCHVSHGSNAAMSGAALKVPFPGAAANAAGDADTPSADSKLLRIDNRGVCVACHNV